MMEWRSIASAPKDGNLWEVSSSGTVRKNGAEVYQYKTDKGYKRFSISGKSMSVHRIVAYAFCDKPHGKNEVNHIDGDKTNNNYTNLEWCNRSENMKHAYRIGLHGGVSLEGEDSPNWGRNGSMHVQSMPVRAIFRDGTYKDYESQGLTSLDGYAPCKVSMCINGKRNTHGGAVWMQLPEPPK